MTNHERNEILRASRLFRGFPDAELDALLGCVGAVTKTFEAGETILMAGDSTHYIGIVLSGSICIENIDIWGNRSVLGKNGAGGIFAESYAFIPDQPLLVDVVALKESEILFLNAEKLRSTCERGCSFHREIISRLLTISSRKNVQMSRRIFYTSSKTIRGRVLAYLSHVSAEKGSRDFTIPFSRAEMADYLNVERSALSGELSKMKKDGLIDYDRSHFRLKNTN